jgi:hypothetical protein
VLLTLIFIFFTHFYSNFCIRRVRMHVFKRFFERNAAPAAREKAQQACFWQGIGRCRDMNRIFARV